MNADEVLTGSFVNAGAIVSYIKKKNPNKVSLVCMGYSTKHPIEEDTFCAEYIKNSLLNSRDQQVDAFSDLARRDTSERSENEKKY